MKERPILFSAPMVRAILAGKKTQTRRIVKPQPIPYGENSPLAASTFPEHMGKPWMPVGGVYREKWKCPYGQPGDRLWVKETWKVASCYNDASPSEIPASEGTSSFGVRYIADGDQDLSGRKRPSIFMPRWASRITLEITGIRVERLNDISEADARAEGIADGGCTNCGNPEPCRCHSPMPSARDSYAHLWSTINGYNSWTYNPWVWVIEFKRL